MAEESDGLAREEALMAASAGFHGRPSAKFSILRRRDGRTRRATDALAVEEPLEIRLGGERVAVTMRTPAAGEDAELAIGFLLGEGIVAMDDVAGAVECGRVGDGWAVDVRLRPGGVALGGWQRNFYATSSCGICGKASVEAVRTAAGRVPNGPRVPASLLTELPQRLRDAQRVFERTGGLHAAGLFGGGGEALAVREDVGRHNAVDKAVGRAAMEGRLPLHDCLLQVSGRASFEIVQKAAMAGVPLVSAVSAPSSLAVELAAESNMTLVGFVRDGGFNAYCGAERIEALEDGGPGGILDPRPEKDH
jgi:FdhD protein